MKSKAVANRSSVSVLVSDDLGKKIERLTTHLRCTVAGLFHKAGHKFLSHVPMKNRARKIKQAIGRYYRTLKSKKLSVEAPSWLRDYVAYCFKKLEQEQSGAPKKRRTVRPSRAAFAP